MTFLLSIVGLAALPSGQCTSPSTLGRWGDVRLSRLYQSMRPLPVDELTKMKKNASPVLDARLLEGLSWRK
jgi:hypothetical protein